MKVLGEFKKFLLEKDDIHSNLILNLYWNEYLRVLFQL